MMAIVHVPHRPMDLSGRHSHLERMRQIAPRDEEKRTRSLHKYRQLQKHANVFPRPLRWWDCPHQIKLGVILSQLAGAGGLGWWWWVTYV